MQPVSEAPGTIKGYEESCYHCQSGWQPYSDFTVPEQLAKNSHNHVVERRQGVRTMTERCQESSPIRQPRHMNGKDLVEPKETVGRDIYAGGEVESGQYGSRKETPCAGVPHRLLYLRQARVLQGFLLCGLHR